MKKIQLENTFKNLIGNLKKKDWIRIKFMINKRVNVMNNYIKDVKIFLMSTFNRLKNLLKKPTKIYPSMKQEKNIINKTYSL